MKKFVAVIIAGSLIAGAVSCGGQGSESTRTRNGAGSARTSFDVPITPQVAAGVEHTCALLSSGAMKCWGSNNYGQLGLGNTDDVNIPTDLPVFEGGARATAISAGADHTCALFDNGAVKCWGLNYSGQLGLRNTTNANKPMLLPVPVDGARATAISAGARHTCALFENGAVKCWGYNAIGQLGLGNTDDVNIPTDLPVFEGGARATAISAGADHTCALFDNGAVKCWGLNYSGQLGLRNTTNANKPMLLPVPVDGARATAISAGARHTCALFENGAVKCWGYNAIGQLGLGNTINVNLQTVDLDLGSGVKVTAIRAGGFHTCALFDNGAVKCWGFNKYGQLGLGDTNNRGGAPNEMGDNLPISYQFQIARVAQTITFSAPTDRVLSATPLTVTATSDSSLLMTLTSSTTSVCTVSGFQVTMLTAGLCTLTAGQTGDSTYLSATDVVRSFTITSVIPPSVPTTEGSTPTTLPTKGSTPTTLPTEGSTPTTLPTEGSTPTTPTTMVLKIVTPTVKKGKSISLSTINQSAKIVIPKKATVVMTVSKASKTICSVSKTTVKALAVGTCSLIVAVTPQATTKVKKPKTVKTPVEVIVTK